MEPKRVGNGSIARSLRCCLVHAMTSLAGTGWKHKELPPKQRVRSKRPALEAVAGDDPLLPPPPEPALKLESPASSLHVRAGSLRSLRKQ